MSRHFRHTIHNGTSMKRAISPYIQEFLNKKIVLLSGPRQVGKTTLSKSLYPNAAYYNYDIPADRKTLRNQNWNHHPSLVIFDELHKMKKWKLWLKGIYDAGHLLEQKILVTGSARLDIAKRMGDSLAGRFLSLRLFPLDLKEINQPRMLEDNYRRLLQCSGFPEPFLANNERGYLLWRRSHSDLILRQDLLSLEQTRDLDGIETLVELLSDRVGSTVSYKSLSEDLDRDDKTVKRWLKILENLYIVFRVPSYSKNITRGIKKAGKYYFYDIAAVTGGEAQKFENLVALSLMKEICFHEDTQGLRGSLYFLQNKERREIDFLVIQRGRPPRLIECKLSESEVSTSFKLFEKYFRDAEKIQLVRNFKKTFQSRDGVKVIYALKYLSDLDFS